jgi:CRP/FNR family transcriptional regulator, cyclic AMP receptor protein
MESLEGILAEHPFLQGMSREHVQLLTGCASNARFDPGKFVFRAGEEANQFYIIREGKVALEIFSPDRGSITIQTLGAGEILGWSWLLPPYVWRFDAHVLELVRAIALDGKCLRTKSEADKVLGYELLKRFAGVMEQRLVATGLQLMDVYGSHA